MKFQTILILAVAAIAGYLSGASAPTHTQAQHTEAQVTPATEAPATLPDAPQSFHPHASTESCPCDCPSAIQIRSIVREELEAFRSAFAVKYQPPNTSAATGPSGSAGGQLSTSGGSTGGSVTNATAAATATKILPKAQSVVRRIVTRSPTVTSGQCYTDANGQTVCPVQTSTRTTPTRARLFPRLFR